MELFEFIKAVFANSSKYNESDNYTRSKHFFMLQRFMSIKYPTRSEAFNINGIKTNRVVDVWRSILPKGNVPYWVWTKGKKKATEKKVKIPSNEAIDYYLFKKGYSKRDLEDSVKIFGYKAYDPIFRIEKLISEK